VRIAAVSQTKSTANTLKGLKPNGALQGVPELARLQDLEEHDVDVLSQLGRACRRRSRTPARAPLPTLSPVFASRAIFLSDRIVRLAVLPSSDPHDDAEFSARRRTGSVPQSRPDDREPHERDAPGNHDGPSANERAASGVACALSMVCNTWSTSPRTACALWTLVSARSSGVPDSVMVAPHYGCVSPLALRGGGVLVWRRIVC
jgi:hypothetical protein